MSRFRVRLPGAGCPSLRLISTLVPALAAATSIGAPSSGESRFAGFEAAPVELGRAMLSRVVRDGLTASALRVPIAAPAEAELELTIDDGANEPLDLRGVSAVLAELPWIYFEAPAGAVTARSGDLTLPKPEYDLEAVRSSVDLAKVPEAKWGEGGTTRIGASGRCAVAARAECRSRRSIRPRSSYTRADRSLRSKEGRRASGLVALSARRARARA